MHIAVLKTADTVGRLGYVVAPKYTLGPRTELAIPFAHPSYLY